MVPLKLHQFAYAVLSLLLMLAQLLIMAFNRTLVYFSTSSVMGNDRGDISMKAVCLLPLFWADMVEE